MTRRTTTPTPEPVCMGTIAPPALGGVPCECFTFTSEADRAAFIVALRKHWPQYATAFATEHHGPDGPDCFLVAVRLRSGFDEAGR